MRIYLVTSVDEQLVTTFQRLIPQLSATANIPDREQLQRVVESSASKLFVAEEDGVIVGTSMLAIYQAPTGSKAWIEDVVVDSSMRGRGVAVSLIEHILSYAKQEGLDKVDLTSSQQRKAAHALYERLGFAPRDSQLFRKVL